MWTMWTEMFLCLLGSEESSLCLLEVVPPVLQSCSMQINTGCLLACWEDQYEHQLIEPLIRPPGGEACTVFVLHVLGGPVRDDSRLWVNDRAPACSGSGGYNGSGENGAVWLCQESVWPSSSLYPLFNFVKEGQNVAGYWVSCLSVFVVNTLPWHFYRSHNRIPAHLVLFSTLSKLLQETQVCL